MPFSSVTGVEMLMKWSDFHTKKEILPTTSPTISTTPLRNQADGMMKWIRRSISAATETLSEGVHDKKTPEGDASQSEHQCSEHKAATNATTVTPISFPAFLNNNGYSTPPKKFNYRRASLIGGLEQTLDVSVSGKSLIVLPLKETKRKLNIAFKNWLAPPKPKRLQPDEELGQQSLLPIPIFSLPKTNSSTSLLNLIEVQTNLDAKKNEPATSTQGSTLRSVIALVVVFLAACALIGSIYNNFPEMSDEERSKVKLPRDIEDAKDLGRVLSKYKETNYFEVMSAFFVTYIFLQTFAIPGSVFLSILSGFMYPFYIALFLVCLCSGIGATGCYVISYFIGKPLIHRYLEERVRKWNEVVDGQREHLFNYLLFLRITPFLPNWFINIVSPIIKIPVSTFFIATFIGVAPLSFIAIQAGTTLYQLTTAGDAISWTGIIIMGVLAVLSLLPVLLKNKLKGKYE